MSIHSRTASAFAWNHIARTGEYLLMYLVSVVIARSIGAELYGAYALFLSAAQMLVVVSSFGLETSILSNFPGGAHGDSLSSRLRPLQDMFALRVAGALVIWGGVLLFRASFSTLLGIPPVLTEYLLVLVVYFTFRTLLALVGAVHIAMLKTGRLAFVSLTARCFELAGVIILFSLGKGLPEVLMLITISACIQFAALLPRSGLLYRHRGAETGDSARMIRMGGRFWLSSLMEFILGRQCDVLLLGLFLVGREAIGRYDAALGLAQGINFGMTAGFMGVATASFASMAAGGDEAALREYWEFLSRVALSLVIPVLILAIVTSEEVISVLYSREYLPGALLFRICGLSLVATRFLGGGLAANLLIARGRTSLIVRSSALSGGVNLFLALALIPLTGVIGAVIATSAGAIVIAVMHARYARMLFQVSFPWRLGLDITVISAASAGAAKIVLTVLPGFGLAGVFFLFAVVFLVLLRIVRPFSMRDDEMLRSMSAAAAGIVQPFVRFRDAG